MECSNTVFFLMVICLIGTGMYCGAGYVALSNTLDLFDTYGPIRGRGNPAKDDSPKYWTNPHTLDWELVQYRFRGNLVPQVFQGVQYYLIALIIFMVINSVIVVFDSVRNKLHIDDYGYDKASSYSSMKYARLLAVYSVLLTVMWLVMAAFGVLPLLEWVITMQRCRDLEDPVWGDGTLRHICVDLVQYGLVFFKEESYSTNGLICGPRADNEMPLGDLKGLCGNYSSTFALYVVSFVGACTVLLCQVLFAMYYTSKYVHFKMRGSQNLPGAIEMLSRPRGSQSYQENYYGNSVHNPNYENNVLLHDPNHMPRDIDSYVRKSPDGEVVGTKDRHYGDGDQRMRRHSSRLYSHPSSNAPDDVVPAFTGHPTASHEGSRRGRRYSGESSEKADLPNSDEELSGSEDHQESSEYESEIDRKPRHMMDSSDHAVPSDYAHSVSGYQPKPMKRRARSTKSDSNIYRQSRKNKARKPPKLDEYDSPPSDFYAEEDLKRRNTKVKSRSSRNPSYSSNRNPL